MFNYYVLFYQRSPDVATRYSRSLPVRCRLVAVDDAPATDATVPGPYGIATAFPQPSCALPSRETERETAIERSIRRRCHRRSVGRRRLAHH